MITYDIEKLTKELIEEALPILEAHRQEISKYKDMPLSIDMDAYLQLQSMDKLVAHVARDEDGKIVGYGCYFIVTNPHYSDFLYAHQDVFYVVKDKRGSRIAYNLIKRSEKDLKERGVAVIVHHAKPSNNFGELLTRLGYDVSEIMYHKRIDI